MSYSGRNSQLQQQQLVSKQEQVQDIVQTQIVLEITQKCIKNIKRLGNLYIAQANKKNSNGDNDIKDDNGNDDNDTDTDMTGAKKSDKSKKRNNKNNNDNNNKEDELESDIFLQQMISGQLLNALRIAVSDPNVVKNVKASQLSLVELGQFKQELLAENVPKYLKEKLLPFVETMQATLQDYKKSILVPGPKLDETTFNDEQVNAGMETFLQSQHNIKDRREEIQNDAENIGKKQNNALNDKKNQELLNSMKNEKIDGSKLNANAMFDTNTKYLDFGDNDAQNEENHLATHLAYGAQAGKETAHKENERKAAQARARARARAKGHNHACRSNRY